MQKPLPKASRMQLKHSGSKLLWHLWDDKPERGPLVFSTWQAIQLFILLDSIVLWRHPVAAAGLPRILSLQNLSERLCLCRQGQPHRRQLQHPSHSRTLPGRAACHSATEKLPTSESAWTRNKVSMYLAKAFLCRVLKAMDWDTTDHCFWFGRMQAGLQMYCTAIMHARALQPLRSRRSAGLCL